MACIPSVLCALLLGVICLEAENSPFSAGANDNASAVGLVLTLAERFSKEPLEHTRVICLCSGCEEVGHYGAIDYLRRHRSELHHPRALVFELVGASGPGWLTQEGIIVPFHSDPELQNLAEKLSDEHPEWGAYPVKVNGGNSELADCVRFKVSAITFFGLTRTGEAPYWHQVADTADKMDPIVMHHTGEFVWEMIKRLDT